MNKHEMIYLLNSTLKEKEINFSLDEKQMDTLALDISRIVDGKITKSIIIFMKNNSIQ